MAVAVEYSGSSVREIIPEFPTSRLPEFSVAECFPSRPREDFASVCESEEEYGGGLAAICRRAAQDARSGASEHAMRLVEGILPKSEAAGEDCAWVYFYYLRDNLFERKSLDYRLLLSRYFALPNTRPSLVHSLVFGLALKIYDAGRPFSCLSFFRFWGPVNLRLDDYLPFPGEKRTIRPLTERLINRIVREPFYTSWSDFREWFSPTWMPDRLLRETFYREFVRCMERLFARQEFETFWQFQRFYLERLRGEAPGEDDLRLFQLALKATNSKFLKYVPWYMKEWQLECAPDELYSAGTDGRSPISIASGKLFDALITAPELYSDFFPWAVSTLRSIAGRMENGGFWNILGTARLRALAGDLSGALSELEEIYPQMKARATYWDFVATLYGDDDRAVSALGRAIFLQPEADATAGRHLHLAQIFASRGSRDEAKSELSQYLRLTFRYRHRLSPSFKTLSETLGYIEPALRHVPQPYYLSPDQPFVF